MRLNGFLLLLFSLACCSDQEQAGSATLIDKEDSVYLPLLNAFGDTVLTGEEIQVTGKKRSLDEVMNIKVVPAGNPVVIEAYPNVYNADELRTVITVDSSGMNTFTVGSIPDPVPLINSIGDTIPTGVPIPAIGKRVLVKWPEPIPALPPRSKDNATLNIKILGVEEGLRSNSVCSILQDRQGNFWFGTLGGGATLYDGVSLWHFSDANGLTENSVYKIFEDSKGRIWFGTQKELMYYDGVNFVQFNEIDGYANNETLDIYEDRSGNLWFGTYFHGLCKYDGEAFTYYNEREGYNAVQTHDIVEDRNGTIWIATEKSGMYKYDDSGFTRFQFTDAPNEMDEIHSVFEDTQGNLYFGSNLGLCIYNGSQFCLYSQEEVFGKVSEIDEDNQGNIWFINGDYGLTKYDGGKFTLITTEEGLSNKRISDLRMIDSGKIWMGTEGGVNIYDPNSFQHPNAFSNTSIKSIFQDSKSNLWFGTRGNGVYKYDGDHYYHFAVDQDPFNKVFEAWAIEEDQDGYIWFVGIGGRWIKYDGLTKANTPGIKTRGTFTHYYPKKDSFSSVNRFATSLVKDKHNSLWIGFQGGGLIRVDGNSFYEFTTEQGMISNHILPRMVKDYQGNLWAFTNLGGVTKIDPGVHPDDPVSLIHFSEKEGFTNKIIHSILPLPSGTVWLGDKSGNIYAYRGNAGSSDSKILTRLNLDGVRDQEQIESMVQDPKGGIWLGTHVGLDRLSIDSLASSDIAFSATTYGKQDGLKGLNFYRPALLDDHNNNWWSTDKGIAFLNADEYKVPDRPPKIQLREIEVNNMKIDYRHFQDTLARGLTFDSVHHFSNIPFNLRIPYKLRSLTFHFSALDWYAPHQIRYSYSLEGLSKDWSAPTKNSHVSFQRLPHGDYMFKIRAKGISNQWSDTLSYSFVIYPPWWDTWWARMLYGIALVGLVVGIVRQRTAALKKRQKELEKIITERMQANNKLRKSEEKYRELVEQLNTIFEVSPVAEVIVDEAGRINQVNKEAENIFGYDRDEMIGQFIEMLLPKHKRVNHTHLRAEFNAKPQRRKMGKEQNLFARHKDGREFPIEVALSPTVIKGEKMVLSAITDISERMEATDKLHKSEEKYRELVDNSIVGVFTTTLDGRFLFVNEAIVQMYDFNNAEQMLAEGSLSRWKDPKQREQLMIELQNYGAVTNFEAETVTHIGQHIHVLFSIKLHGENIIGMVMDITKRKIAEEAILKYQRRLKDLAHKVTIAEEVTRKQIAVDLHDHVGQLLASIRVQLASINKVEENPEIIDRIENISEVVRTAIQATRDAIFNLSLPQLNELGLYAAVHDWMHEEIELKHNLNTSISGEDEKFDFDENTRFLLFRSIRELMINVVKHAQAIRLNVDFKRKDEILEISVQDDGIGFNYSPNFLRMKSTTYGLFSIQERLSDLGGTMTVDSERGNGTNIKLLIPLKDDQP